MCCKLVAMFDAAICNLLLRRRYGPDEDSCYSVFDSLKVSVSQFIVRSQSKISVQKQPTWKQIVWTPYVHLLQQVQNGDLSLRVCCLQHTKAQTFCKPSCDYFDGKRKSLLNNVQYGLCVRSRGVGLSATQKNDSAWCRLSLRLKSFATRAALPYWYGIYRAQSFFWFCANDFLMRQSSCPRNTLPWEKPDEWAFFILNAEVAPASFDQPSCDCVQADVVVFGCSKRLPPPENIYSFALAQRGWSAIGNWKIWTCRFVRALQSLARFCAKEGLRSFAPRLPLN